MEQSSLWSTITHNILQQQHVCIYVCMYSGYMAYVCGSTAQDTLRLSTLQPPVHTHPNADHKLQAKFEFWARPKIYRKFPQWGDAWSLPGVCTLENALGFVQQ